MEFWNFKVHRRYMWDKQSLYILTDWFNKIQKEIFYQVELQRVETDEDSLFLIEKIIKYKGQGKNQRSFSFTEGLA